MTLVTDLCAFDGECGVGIGGNVPPILSNLGAEVSKKMLDGVRMVV